MRAKVSVFTHDEVVKKLGFPEGTIITEVIKDFHNQDFKFVVHSDKFREVPQGSMLVHERY